MTKMKMLVSISVALALVLALMPAVALAADDPIGGSFTLLNADPTVDTVALWSTGGGAAAATAMDPQVEYNVKVDVTDDNTLDNLSTITVTIFYDALGTYDAGEVPGAGNVQTAAILTWTNAEPNTWTIDAVNGASTDVGYWEIVDGSCVEPVDMDTETTGTFEFHFIPGAVATETVAPAVWHIYAEADDGTATGDNHQDDRTMNWYGGITVNTASIDWGTVIAGMDFAEGDPSEEAGISVTYIANGAYDEKVAASASWTGTPSGSATLNEAGTPGANEFSLIADDTGTLPVGVGGLVTATTTGYITIDDTGIQTDEDGDTVTTNSLWLKLGTPFAGAQYDGSIYYQIAEGS